MKQQRLTRDELIREVKDYCIANYENGWCDAVIETMSDFEIRLAIGRATTLRGAIYKLRCELAPWAARRADIEATAF